VGQGPKDSYRNGPFCSEHSSQIDSVEWMMHFIQQNCPVVAAEKCERLLQFIYRRSYRAGVTTIFFRGANSDHMKAGA